MRSFFNRITQDRNDIAEHQLNTILEWTKEEYFDRTDQTTIDADAFFRSLACCSGSFQTFRTCQVNEMDFGTDLFP